METYIQILEEKQRVISDMIRRGESVENLSTVSASFNLRADKAIMKVLNEQPNPTDYPDTPEGVQEFRDDYWGGNSEAEAYHDDMGDR